jgi:hypothetical protein
MKKFALTILLFLVALTVGASDNYTIAIVPYIKSTESFEASSSEKVYNKTNEIYDMEISDLNMKATNEVASIFNKYIIPYIELNKSQKINLLTKLQSKKILEAKETLSGYYAKVANNNYQSIDLDEYEDNIESATNLIKEEQSKLDNFLIENESTEEFINTLDITLPSNIKSSSKAEGDILIKVIDNYSDCFLLSNYPMEYRDAFLNSYNIDEIVFVEVDRLSSFNNLKIYFEDLSILESINDNESYQSSLNLIFDRIIVNDSISSLDQYILLSLINSLSPTLSIIKNDIQNVNISIKKIIAQDVLDEIQELEDKEETPFLNNSVVYVDTNKITSFDTIDISNTSSYILLDEGTHYFYISGPNIYSYVLKVISNRNQITSISTEGNPAQNGFLLLNSNIGKVNWIIDGQNFGFKNSLEIDNQIIPSTILIEKENFSNLLIELNKPTSLIDISLNPPWMGESAVFEKKQNDFYKGLLNYIIGCATFISIKTINNIYGADTSKAFINNLNDGVLILSQVDIVYQLVSYIKLATN